MDHRLETFRFGELTLSIQRPRDPEALIDGDRFDRDEFLPYWAEPWPSGLALAAHIATLELFGLTVLELGCGLGLPSLVAASAGAHVRATDWAPDAVACLAANARRNDVSLRCATEDWFGPRRTDPIAFDLVLAADVLYEERNLDPVLASIEDTISPAGTALVGDPGRRHAAAFPAAANDRGFHVERLESPHLPHGAIWRLCRNRNEVGATRS
jgi:predicted nicotinamide N-methyase